MLVAQGSRLQATSCCPMSRLGQAAPHSPVPACHPCRALTRNKSLVPRAAASNSTDEGDQSLKDEARLEALERGVKRKQGARLVASQDERMRRAEDPNRGLGSGGMAEWKEGALFPEGWDSMDLPKKVTELYTGKRGLLFWMGKVTYALIFILIGGWIVFRFVLPGLGVLELQNGLDSPPNYGQ